MAQAGMKTTIRSNFPAVKEAAYLVVQEARDLALAAGEEVAIQKVQQLNDSRGYNLDEENIGKETIGHQSGRVFIGSKEEGEFWWRFFEYGTRYIIAFPMIRPASRAMRKVFVGVMGSNFEKWVRARSRL